MPFGELKGFAREIFLEQQIEELGRVYRRAQKSLKAKLDRIDITDFNKARTEAILLQVNQEITALNFAARNWANPNVKLAYESGLELSEERLKKLGITRFVNFDARIHKSAVSVLVDEVATDLVAANLSMKTEITRYVRLTQQRILEDKEISRLVAQGLIQGETRRAGLDMYL